MSYLQLLCWIAFFGDANGRICGSYEIKSTKPLFHRILLFVFLILGSLGAKLQRLITKMSSTAREQSQPVKLYKQTPLPLRQMIPMAFVLLSDSLCATVLTPFVGLFIAHLGNRSPNEAGYVSGVLLAMFMIGQVISAKTWGWISDQYGRRLPLIVGLFTSGLMMLFFGLSTTVWQCALFRLLQGIFNGNILVAKTMMADITDKTNETFGFSFVSFCFGFGNLIGPGLGGLLYNPSQSSALSFLNLSPDGVFGRYPALLPCLVIFLYSNVGMIVCTFYVQESNPDAQPLPVAVRTFIPCLWPEPEIFVHSPLVEIDENGLEVTIVDASDEELLAEVDGPCAEQQNVVAVPPVAPTEPTSFGYAEAFSMPVTRAMLITYMVLCGSDSIARECLPLWAISSSLKGGLDLNSDKVGFILLLNSIPLFAANFTFSWACSQYNDKMGLFRLGMFLAGLGVFFLPLTVYMGDGSFLFLLIIVCTSIRQFCCTWAYSLNTMFIARAAPPGKVGAIMGINQSSGATTRALIPLLSAPIFAWSISGNHFYPFNHSLVFVFATCGFFYCAIRSLEVRSSAASTSLQMVDVKLQDVIDGHTNRFKRFFGFSTEEEEGVDVVIASSV